MIRYTKTLEEKFLATFDCSSDAHITASTEGKKCSLRNFVLLNIKYLLERFRYFTVPLSLIL